MLSDVGSDFDFEDLDFDEKFKGEKAAVAQETRTKQHEAAQQEDGETETYVTESVNIERPDDENRKNDFVRVSNAVVTPEEDNASLDGDFGQNKEDEEMFEGAWDLSVHCEFYGDNKEDGIFSEGRPLALEGTENPQVRRKEQGVMKRDEDLSYFVNVAGCGSKTVMSGDGTKAEKRQIKKGQEDAADSESEYVKTKQNKSVCTKCSQTERPLNPNKDGLGKTISGESLQDLNAEVDVEDDVERVNEFSGEEHQEAGESFASYSSDFSSFEYLENEGTHQESYFQLNFFPKVYDIGSDSKLNSGPQRPVIAMGWTGGSEDIGGEVDGYQEVTKLGMDEGRVIDMSLATAGRQGGNPEIVECLTMTRCTDEGEPREDEGKREKGIYRDLLDLRTLEDAQSKNTSEDTQFHIGSESSSGWSISTGHHTTDCYSRPQTASFSFTSDPTTDSLLSEGLVTPEDKEEAATLSSDESPSPAEDNNGDTMVPPKDGKIANLSNQGFLNDGFFNTLQENQDVTQLGQLGNDEDEYEEERNWEKEQERIKAFYKFYDDSELEKRDNERKIKVQFCTNPLSQVINFETDSSDAESFSSSMCRDEDLSPAEIFEEIMEADDIQKKNLMCDIQNTQPMTQESDHTDTQISPRKNKCLTLVNLAGKMGLAFFLGVLLLWFASEQVDWLNLFHIYSD